MLKFLFSLFFVLISGCTLLSPVENAPTKTYLLNTPSFNRNVVQTHANNTLFIAMPIASPWLDTTKMAYQLQPDQLNYFVLNQWASPPAQLIQPIILQAIQQSHLYQMVVIGPYVGNADQRLDIRLLTMQQQFWQKPSSYRITLQVQLTNIHTGKIIAAKQLDATVLASNATPESGVIAANQAFAILLSQLIIFCQKYAATNT